MQHSVYGSFRSIANNVDSLKTGTHLNTARHFISPHNQSVVYWVKGCHLTELQFVTKFTEHI